MTKKSESASLESQKAQLVEAEAVLGSRDKNIRLAKALLVAMEAKEKREQEQRRRKRTCPLAGIVHAPGADQVRRRGAPCTFLYLVCDASDADSFRRRYEPILAYYESHAEMPPCRSLGVDHSVCERVPLCERHEGRKLVRDMFLGDHLVLHFADLGRSRKDYLRQLAKFWRKGIVLHLLDDPYEPIVVRDPLSDDDRLRLAELVDATAEEVKSRRTSETLKQQRNERKPYSHRPPFGFSVLQMPTGPVLAACKHERRWAAMIVRWRSKGLTLPQIHVELKRRRAKTNQGKPWTLRRLERFAAFLSRERPAWAGLAAEPAIAEPCA